MTWFNEFNATFWLAIGALTSSGFALLLKYMFKSKCKRFSCCGFFVVERDIENEIREQEIETQQQQQQQHPTETIPETTIHNDDGP